MLVNLRKMIIPRFIRNLKRSQKGTIIIEFALTFPITLIMLLGGFETFRLLMAHRKTSMTVTSVSNLVSQNKALTSGGLKNIFDAVENIMTPLELDEKGQIFVSYITGTAGGNAIGLQCKGTANKAIASKLGKEGDKADLSRLPGNFTVAQGETVVISEVIYGYEPVFANLGFWKSNIFSAQNVYQVSAQKPRYGTILFDSKDPCP